MGRQPPRKPAAKTASAAKSTPKRKPAAPKRPPAPTPANTQAKIVKSLALCLPREIAAQRAGIHPRTLADWMDLGRAPGAKPQYVKFVAAVEAAELTAEGGLVATIVKKAVDGDVRAATWLLERLRPERWVRQSVSRAMPPARPDDDVDEPVPGDPTDEFDDLDNVTPLRKR